MAYEPTSAEALEAADVLFPFVDESLSWARTITIAKRMLSAAHNARQSAGSEVDVVERGGKVEVVE